MNTNIFVGREKERAILEECLVSNSSEMVAVIGRRRVGKTLLVKHTFGDQINFSFTGVQNVDMRDQLVNFTFELNRVNKGEDDIPRPKDWMNAFIQLINYLEQNKSDKKQVVFFDELPWIATPKSGFLKALGFFWNSWAVDQNIVVVVCGSAASWMIQKVVNNTGGLHNRITRRIFLYPFDLSETEAYLKSRNIVFNRYQIVQLYMAIGGIPHYLKEIKDGKSAIQNIEEICFSRSGILYDEFGRLYPSLFSNAENHIRIIKLLSKRQAGMTRNQITQFSKIPNGGGLSKVLKELEQSGFISGYIPFTQKKKDIRYRLTDEYSLFYLKFMDDKLQPSENTWQQLSQTQSYKSWSGYAFENVCLKHIDCIKKALGISGIYSTTSTFYYKGSAEDTGLQIDLLIDRNDQVVNLVEIKFYNEPFSLDKRQAEKMSATMGKFKHLTKTKKQLFWTLVTTFGLNHNQHSLGLIQQVLTLDDLFD